MSELLPELAGVEYWMLTDKIRYPKVMQLAYQHEAAPELADLFINSPFAYLMPQSPVIFRLRHDSSLLPIWQNDSLWRSSAVIFASQAGAFDTLKQHLLALLQPRILGRQTIFRYYSNQTLDPCTLNWMSMTGTHFWGLPRRFGGSPSRAKSGL